MDGKAKDVTGQVETPLEAARRADLAASKSHEDSASKTDRPLAEGDDGTGEHGDEPKIESSTL